jgi:NifU-like protein involved in Fe-S cluster formation
MPTPLDDHFHAPRNAGVLAGADVAVKVENPVCGDVLHLYLKRGTAGRVEACTFQVYGCPAAIAAGSLLTESLKGLAPEEMRALTRERITSALGGLTAEKAHAAVLARDAIEAALAHWPGARKPD